VTRSMSLVLPLFPVLAVLALTACKSLGADLPSDPVPLFDMEEPAAYLMEPDDEAARRELPLGSYSGVHVADAVQARGALDEEPASPDEEPVRLDKKDYSLIDDGADGLDDDVDRAPEPPSVAAARSTGVLVRRVIENSPGDAAGLEPDDLLHSVGWTGAGELPLQYGSDWRAVEDDVPPGTALTVKYDRAGLERTATILVAPRVRPRDRTKTSRYREGLRAGIVLRTATEVEAKRAGLAAGAGAVIVGLSSNSPFRGAGLKYGDVLAAVDRHKVSHPQVVLDAIREADDDAVLAVTVVRGEEPRKGSVPLTRRARGLRNVSIPLIYSCGTERGETETSILSGLLRRRTTRAAWEWRVLWLFSFSGGDADRLEDSE